MSTRDRILDGAAEVMRTRGLANTTTKEIAKAAGLSEAMLYKVFRDKVDLFLGVLSERLPRIAVLRDGPAEHLGRDTMPAGLRRLVAELLSFYLEAFPIAASVFSDPELLTRHREALRERGAGPHTVAEGVAAYLAAEQQAGRLAPTARPDVMAELLVGACLHRAFLVRFAGRTATPDHIRRFAEDVVKALEPALTT
ncbi:MAG: TetR/AcrR family transcriptional regulator [Pseudonocardiaceae bacterium]